MARPGAGPAATAAGVRHRLLHGYPLNSTIWHTQQNGLSDHFRVITPDLRGHGQSPAPEGVYEMDQMAQDVFALLDSLNVQKAAIMGHSMGGYVTLAMWRLALCPPKCCFRRKLP